MAFLFKSVFSFNSSTVCHWSFPKAHCHSSPHCLLSSSLIIPWVEWNLEFFCSISLSPALTVTVDMDKASAQTMKDASKFKTYVSANPYARSSISSSSSVGFCGNSLKFCWLNIKWHVEHANVPSHAPETHAYRVAPKNWHVYCTRLTFFTVRMRKCVTVLSLKISPHLKYVTTLPCEMSVS